jgi:hypothetical protein
VRRLAAAALLVALLAGCGQPTMSRAAAGELQRDVAAIRAAAEDGRRYLVKQRLNALAEEVARLLRRGEIDPAAAAEILDSIDVVRAALPLVPAPSPTVVDTPTPTPEDGDGGEDGGGGEGEGNAYGKDKDGGKGDGGHGNDD